MTPARDATTIAGTHAIRPDDSTFGARLALIRQAKGWNVKEAAVACDLPGQSWRRWEQGPTVPRGYLATCRRIALAASVDLAWLVGVDDEEGKAS
jgi:transcriptional regulator with XRE-family HTH domain